MTEEFSTSTPNHANDARENVAAYSIGATDRAESAEVERLLAADPGLKREAAQYAAAATLLNATVPRVQPPAALKDKILTAARTARPATPVLMPKPQAAAPTRTRVRDVLVFLASAAAVLLIGVNVYWMNRVNELEALEAAAEHEREMAVALLTNAESKRIELMDDDGSMRAMIVFAEGHSEALMVTHNLPSLTPGRTYQLWQIDGEGRPVSVGLFNTTADGRLSMIFKPPLSWHSVEALGISVEPEGGSETPTTEPIALATMA